MEVKMLRYIILLLVSIVGVATSGQTISYSYTPRTNFLQETKTETLQLRYQYDAVGNLTSVVFKSNPLAQVDLFIDSLLTDTTFYTDQPSIVKVRLQNQGLESVDNFYVSAFFSVDGNYQRTDTLLNKTYIDQISVETDEVADLSITVPPSMISDSAFLVLVVDETDLIAETNENNNVLVVPISVLSSDYQPDWNQAEIKADIQSGCAGTEVQFTDFTPNEPFEWQWVFYGGNPGFSSEQNPLVTYDTEGDFPVTLTVSNADGTFTRTFQNQIDISDDPVLIVNNVPDQLEASGGTFSLYIENPCGTSLDWHTRIVADHPWLTLETPFAGHQPDTLIFSYEESTQRANTAHIHILADRSKNKEVVVDVVQGVDLNRRQTLSLQRGWNFVSFYTDVSDPIEELVDHIKGVVEEVKSSYQGAYYPDGSGVNFTIDPLQAYWIRVNDPVTWEVRGAVMKPEKEAITLRKGKNQVTFLGTPKRVRTALVSIEGELVRVKTAEANYALDYGVLNSMDFMIPGQGYEIEVTEDIVLQYPSDQ